MPHPLARVKIHSVFTRFETKQKNPLGKSKGVGM